MSAIKIRDTAVFPQINDPLFPLETGLKLLVEEGISWSREVVGHQYFSPW